MKKTLASAWIISLLLHISALAAWYLRSATFEQSGPEGVSEQTVTLKLVKAKSRQADITKGAGTSTASNQDQTFETVPALPESEKPFELLAASTPPADPSRSRLQPTASSRARTTPPESVFEGGPTAAPAPEPSRVTESARSTVSEALPSAPAIDTPARDMAVSPMRTVSESSRYVIGTEQTPHPRYPLLARRHGWQGTVEVALLVNSRGEAIEARLAKSSGFPMLDQAAVETLSGWQLAAVAESGQQWLTVPVEFRLR